MNKILDENEHLVVNLHVKDGKLSDYFDIPNSQIKEISTKIYNKIQKEIVDKTEIHFLALGVGDGRFEIPIMQYILEKQPETTIYLDYCDISTQLSSTFINSIKGNERIKINAQNLNVNDNVYHYVPKLKGKEEYEYDIITAFYLLHFLPAWEEVLALLLSKCISEKTHFLFSEEMGDTCWIDNVFVKDEDFEDVRDEYLTLSDYRKELRKFWKKYHKIRGDELGKPWFPLLSASNMSLIAKCCDVLFENKETFSTYWDINSYRIDDFKEFIIKPSPSFYPLNYGITCKDKEKIKSHIQNCSITNQDSDCKRKEGTKIFIYSNGHNIGYDGTKKIILSQQSSEIINSLSVLPHNYQKTTDGRIKPKEGSKTYEEILWRDFLKIFTGQRLFFSYYLWKPNPFNLEEGDFIDTLPFSLINFNFDEKELNKYIRSYCLYEILKPDEPKEFFLLKSLLKDFNKTISLHVNYVDTPGCEPIVKIKQHFQSKLVIEIKCSSIIYQDFLEKKCVKGFINRGQHITTDLQNQFTIFDFKSTIDKIVKDEQNSVQDIRSEKKKYASKLSHDKKKYIVLLINKLSDVLRKVGVRVKSQYDEQNLKEKIKEVSKSIIESILIVPIIGRFNDENVFTKNIYFCLGDALRMKSNEEENGNFHKNEIGFGGFIIISPKQEFNLFENEWFIENRNKTLNSILNIQSNIDGIAIYSNKLKEEINKESIKSAVAAIMSRNLSHNLGSHVISGTKNYLINKNYITNIGDNKGIYRLYQYLQERMDFVAVICNSVHNHYTFNAPLNLKADILDEFAADGRDERHPSDKTKDEWTKSFLLEHIVRSEDIIRSTSDNNKMKGIEIILLRQDRKDKDKILSFTSQKNGDNDARDFNDINFSVPLGINSRHAFLTILENFIRNSAKHNHHYPQNVNKLLISILIKEEDNGFIIKIFDNKPTDEKKVQELQDIIDNKIHILKDGNVMDPDYKGMKEMLICTAWLNGSDCSNDWSIIERNKDNALIKYGIEPLKDIKEKVFNSIVGNNTDSRKEEIRQLWNEKTKALSICFTLPKHRFIWYTEIPTDDIKDEIRLSVHIEKLESADFYIVKITEKSNQNSTIEQELSDTIKESIIKMHHTLPNVIFIYEEYFYIYIKNGIKKICTIDSVDIRNKENKKINIIDEYQNNIIEVLSWCYQQTELEPQETLIEYKISPAKEEDFGYNSFNRSNSIIHRENEKYCIKGVKDKIRLFINHNDNTEIFAKNYKTCHEYYNDKMIFLEGVSGASYNYNLIINAPVKEAADYYKIIQACDAKIAIIDERIFKKYKGKKFGANNLEKLHYSIEPENIEQVISEMQEYFDSDLNLSNDVRDIVGKISGFDTNEDEVYKWMDGKKAVFGLFSENLRGNNSDSKNYVKNWLELKNIFLYDADVNGTLTDLDENKNVKLPADIDFITVHYGIIEKFAENQKIKSENKLKEGLIQFLAKTGITYNENTNVRVAMHSGRGGFVDSQKEIPFIPVSMLDAQLNDCKYKLAQLFLNMKYKRIK